MRRCASLVSGVPAGLFARSGKATGQRSYTAAGRFLAPQTLTSMCRVIAKPTHLICARPDGRVKLFPIVYIHIGGTEYLEAWIAISRSGKWLDLKEWISFVELDRRIGSGQSDIREKRSKSSVGFNYTLVILASLCVGQIGNSTR
jgi:hypothetical protein